MDSRDISKAYLNSEKANDDIDIAQGTENNLDESTSEIDVIRNGGIKKLRPDTAHLGENDRLFRRTEPRGSTAATNNRQNLSIDDAAKPKRNPKKLNRGFTDIIQENHSDMNVL